MKRRAPCGRGHAHSARSVPGDAGPAGHDQSGQAGKSEKSPLSHRCTSIEDRFGARVPLVVPNWSAPLDARPRAGRARAPLWGSCLGSEKPRGWRRRQPLPQDARCSVFINLTPCEPPLRLRTVPAWAPYAVRMDTSTVFGKRFRPHLPHEKLYHHPTWRFERPGRFRRGSDPHHAPAPTLRPEASPTAGGTA